MRHPGTNYYSVDWQPAVAGSYKIIAYAIDSQGGYVYEQNTEDLPNVGDNRGNVGVSTPVYLTINSAENGSLPMVDLISPLDGSSLTTASSIRLEANASDADGSITQVEFYVDGELNATLEYNASYLQPNFVYGTTWSPDANGSHRIHAVAVDNGGNRVMSEVVTVSVVPGVNPPSLALTSLSGEDFYEGDQIFLSLSQLTDDGVIESVEFYVNGELIGIRAEFPYDLVWTAQRPGF